MERLLKREEVKKEYTWDLESVYASHEAWERDYQKVVDMVPRLTQFQGKIGQSAQTLLQALKTRDEVFTLFYQLATYGGQRRDENATNSTYQGMADRTRSLGAQVGAAVSYMTPEILEIQTETLRSWMNQDTGLQDYRFELEDTIREKEHVRSAEVEELMAQYSEIAGSPNKIFSLFYTADLKFPKVKNEAGEEVDLTEGRFAVLRESHNRQVRREVFETLYGTYHKFRNTLAATHSSSVKKDVIIARARRFPSARAAALSGNNIPESVYDNLIEAVHRNLPRLHRYMQIRKRILDLDDLHMYDLYVPMVADVDRKIPYEEAVDTVLKALAPLGEEYLSIARAGLTSERWVDIYENEGKRSGAYSGGAYTTKPFILLNYNENLDSMFTLAHELGHSMHSYFTRQNQPFQYGNYTIFVAEVASTFNEALLTEYLLKSTTDKKLRRYLINHQLEGFRATLYRQTMFAEFEKLTHAKAEANQPLTADLLSAMYYDLNKQYYGTEGVVVDQWIDMEWARIPHFYTPFYVYQYATGISAATALSQKVLQEGQSAVEAYLGFLKKGGSAYSIELLKGAGVDMSSPEPVQQALDVFDRLLGEMEQVVG